NLNKKSKQIEFYVPYGTDLTRITIDNILVSSTSNVSLENGDTVDFTQPVRAVVTDLKGNKQRWTIKAIEKEKQVVVTSSNQKLQESFDWAIDKTRRFVMTGQHDLVNRDEFNNDGDGTADYIPSYWAGYFDR
ncbi:hypothetical protein ACPV5F_21210, partial [Vibrio alfacsensis]